MTGIPNFFNDLEDSKAADNFRQLRTFLLTETPFLGFRFFEVKFERAVTNYDFKHNLGFQPLDAVLTNASNGAAVTFGYDSFSRDTVRLTVDKASVVRFLLGTFSGATS